MPVFERLSVVVSITLIGLALYFVLDFPAQVAEVSLLGSPLQLESPQQWLMMVLLGGLALAGTDAIIRAQPALRGRNVAYVATFWPLPTLLVLLATQTLGLAVSPVIWAASLVGAGILLWGTISAETHLIPSPGHGPLWARVWQQFVGYAIVLTFAIIIYHTRVRSAVSATSMILVGGGASLALLRQPPDSVFRTWLFALVIGLSLGQITWALNYWRTGALNAGLLLFFAFYVLVGLAYQHLQNTLSRRALWEYGAISAAAAVVIFLL
ncbi:MAG: hypothetical protein D6768_04930 [Chloroflexi bacterium]|nr:MAG: hypothetical protein D6768_04930 [Chloroflexota bacterium]